MLNFCNILQNYVMRCHAERTQAFCLTVYAVANIIYMGARVFGGGGSGVGGRAFEGTGKKRHWAR